MKKTLIFITAILLLASCNKDKQNTGTQMPTLYPVPQSVAVNTEKGYIINPVTGDSIQPLLNSFGDTIITGKPIPAVGKVINSDSLSKPKVVKVGTPKVVPGNLNIHKIPDELTVITINKDSIKIHTPDDDNSSSVLVNSIGDTIPTGVPVPAKGKVVPCLQPKPVKALPPRFKDAAFNNMQYLDVDQGMNSSNVKSILEDKNGNIWFGTIGGGVSKYDGESFTHYTENEGLSNNIVLAILEDKNGNLWFGTEGGGVSKYDGESFTHYTENEGLSNNIVWSILEDKSGNLWFGTDGSGVTKYEPPKEGQVGTFTHYTEKEGLSNKIVLSILEDKNGNLWFGTDGGVSKYEPPKTGHVGLFTHYTEKEGLSGNYVLAILEDKSGNLWFGNFGGGVSKYEPPKDGQVGTFTHYTEKEGLSDNRVWSILEDKSGNLWFGTYGGVNKYEPPKDGQVGTFTHYTEKEGLSNNIVLSILEDKSGNLWFGTYFGGVSKYNVKSFTHYTEKEGLSNNSVMSILEDKSGNLWFGTSGGGVNKFDGESFIHYTEKEGLSHNIILSIVEDKNRNLWFGTYGGGVCKFEPPKGGQMGTFTYYTENEGLSSNKIMSILEDKSGNLWFGTDGGGVSKFEPPKDGQMGRFTHYTEKEGLSSKKVLSILEDKSGNLWFGTDGGGVSKFEPPKDGQAGTFTHYTEKEGLSNNFVRSILEDKSGNLWFGTYYGGISKYEPPKGGQVGRFTYYTENEGLSNRMVWAIMEDNSGNIWISTEKGLNLLHSLHGDISTTGQENDIMIMDDTYSIYRFGKQDGLKGEDFFANSAFIDSKNRAWWGSGKSLTMLDMNTFTLSKKSPAVQLKRIDINEHFIDYHNLKNNAGMEIEFDGVANFYNYPLNLELPYKSNHLAFHFSAIDWAAPHKIKYSYKMEGLNDKWSIPSKETKADYRNLPYGTFTFKVQATGEAQVWSDPFEYTFTIYPPWWHTWWARASYGLTALLLVFSYVRWRTAKLKQRQKELETEVNIATKEIREQKDEVEKQKEVIEVAHKEITDSIAYAKRIQSAILPSVRIVKEYLKESFILYKPKDVVAGDFYWIEPKEDKVLFAAADCTGHGVPGAMVSVVCNNALNRSVREYGLSNPGQILDKVRDIVIQEFEKSEEEVKDGMDIALCTLDGKKLQYAGAYNPLWIIRNGEVLETKANKQPIGKFYNPLPFTTHSFDLEKGDTLYIFSDGYVDQFGGEKDKKFKVQAFREMLKSIQDKTMEEQKLLIDETFENWKGNFEQIDDVCVIGVRI